MIRSYEDVILTCTYHMVAGDAHTEKIIPLCDAHENADQGHYVMNI